VSCAVVTFDRVFTVEIRLTRVVFENPCTVDTICAVEIYPRDPRPFVVEVISFVTVWLRPAVVEVSWESEMCP
jgi:hypothetical protein